MCRVAAILWKTEYVTFESLERMFGPSVRRRQARRKCLKFEHGFKSSGRRFRELNLRRTRCQRGRFATNVLGDDGRDSVIITTADRLHNMRTLGSMKPKEVKNERNLLVFAILAKLLGMYDMKNELEEIAFGWASPGCYEAVTRRKEELERVHLPVIINVAANLNEALKNEDFLRGSVISFAVDKHVKENYGIYRKALKSKKKPRIFIHDDEEDNISVDEEENVSDYEEGQT